MDKEIAKLAKRYPLKVCPICKQRSGAHIIHGYPVDGLFEFERLGRVVLMGSEPPLADEPYCRYQCTACKAKFGESS